MTASALSNPAEVSYTEVGNWCKFLRAGFAVQAGQNGFSGPKNEAGRAVGLDDQRQGCRGTIKRQVRFFCLLHHSRRKRWNRLSLFAAGPGGRFPRGGLLHEKHRLVLERDFAPPAGMRTAVEQRHLGSRSRLARQSGSGAIDGRSRRGSMECDSRTFAGNRSFTR